MRRMWSSRTVHFQYQALSVDMPHFNAGESGNNQIRAVIRIKLSQDVIVLSSIIRKNLRRTGVALRTVISAASFGFDDMKLVRSLSITKSHGRAEIIALASWAPRGA